MAEISQNKRAIIIQYRFVENLSYPDITSRVRGVTADGVKKLCQRTRQRANSDNIDTLLENCYILPRSGCP